MFKSNDLFTSSLYIKNNQRIKINNNENYNLASIFFAIYVYFFLYQKEFQYVCAGIKNQGK